MKERKMKWPLMSDRSSQQQTTRQQEKSPQTPADETREQHGNYYHATTSAALNTTSLDSKCLGISRQMNIVLIVTLIGLVFGFILPDLDAFNNEIIDLNDEFKLENVV